MCLIDKKVLPTGSYHNRQKGFSLLEVMISLLLISIGLMSMTSLQSRSVNISNVAYTETQSTLLMQEIVELLRANKVAAASGAYNITLSSFDDFNGSPAATAPIAEIDRYNWFNNLNNTLFGAEASIKCDADSRCTLVLQYEFSGTSHSQSLAVIL